MTEKTPWEKSTSEKDVEESPGSPEQDIEAGQQHPAKLTRGLQGRHMQMIAIGEQELQTGP